MARKFRLATYEELISTTDALGSRLGARIDRLSADFRSELRTTAAETDVKLDRLLTAMDRMTGELLENRQSHIVFGAMFGDHRRTLESHNQRLGALEGRVPPAP